MPDFLGSAGAVQLVPRPALAQPARLGRPRLSQHEQPEVRPEQPAPQPPQKQQPLRERPSQEPLDAADVAGCASCSDGGLAAAAAAPPEKMRPDEAPSEEAAAEEASEAGESSVSGQVANFFLTSASTRPASPFTSRRASAAKVSRKSASSSFPYYADAATLASSSSCAAHDDAAAAADGAMAAEGRDLLVVERSASSSSSAAPASLPVGSKQEGLSCPICEEVVYRPVRTRCGHGFCLACLSLWLKESPLQNCPLCRNSLAPVRVEAPGGDPEAEPILPPYEPDFELERQAIARLGASAYCERELDTVDGLLQNKLRAYRHKLEQIKEGSGVAALGLGVAGLTAGATVWTACTAAYVNTMVAAQAVAVNTLAAGAVGDGVGLFIGAHSYASTAFWSTIYSAEMASTATALGLVAGAGACAFLGGMKLAAWLDDQGRYVALRSPFTPSTSQGVCSNSVWILNLLTQRVLVRVSAAKRRTRKRLSMTESWVHYIAAETGVSNQTPKKGEQYLEAVGPVLVEQHVEGKSEGEIRLPPKESRLLLNITLEGLLMETEVASIRARGGRRFIICEFDEQAREVLRQKTAEGGASPNSTSPAAPEEASSDSDDSAGEAVDNDVSRGSGAAASAGAPPPQWRRERWESFRRSSEHAPRDSLRSEEAVPHEP